MQLTVAMRYNGRNQYSLIVDAQQEQLTLRFTDTLTAANTKFLSPVVPLPGLQRGRVVKIAVATSGPRFLLYLDGELVADVSDDRLPEATTPTSTIGLGAAGAKGSFLVRGMRVYQIAEVLPTTTK
jgi:hypothetical protein